MCVCVCAMCVRGCGWVGVDVSVCYYFFVSFLFISFFLIHFSFKFSYPFLSFFLISLLAMTLDLGIKCTRIKNKSKQE